MKQWIRTCQAFGRLHRAKMDFDKAKREHPLTYLFWECTLGCNLTCRHCGSRCSPGLLGAGDLSTDEAKRIFSEIAEDFPAGEITVAVTGGEPLTRHDLFEVMAHARRLGFHWGMVTNGVLITPETIERMRDSGMETVTVSIDGDAKGHSVLRGSEENWTKAMRGLSLLLAEPRFLTLTQVTSVIHKRNLDQLQWMHDRFSGMGVDDWRLLMVDPIGRMKDAENQELLLTGQDLAALLDFVAAKRENPPSRPGRAPMSVTFEESGFLGLKYEGRVRDYYFQCPAGIHIGSILHDGAISACPSLERDMVEGDAKSERFSEVWSSRFKRYRDRENTRKHGPCENCKWWHHCEGGSLHLWDWDAKAPRLCHYHMLQEVPTR